MKQLKIKKTISSSVVSEEAKPVSPGSKSSSREFARNMARSRERLRQEHENHVTRVLFIYGYGGGTDSTFCRLLRESLPAKHYDVRCYIYSQEDCAAAVAELESIIRREEIELVVGTSLGGFLTLCLNYRLGVKRLVINPCMRPSVELPKLQPRPDHPEDKAPAPAMVATYAAYEEVVNTPGKHERENVYGAFAENDELLGTRYVNSFRHAYIPRDSFSAPAPVVTMIPGGHHGNPEAIPALVKLLDKILRY